MLCDSSFARFINILAENANSFEVIKEAFGELVDKYRFGEVRIRYHVKERNFNAGEEDSKYSVFLERGNIDEKNIYSKEYRSEENGIAKFSLVALKGARPWTDQEKRDMDIMFEILFFHLGKFRLMGIVRTSSITDYMTGLPNTEGYFVAAEALLNKNELKNYNAFYFNLKGFGLVNMKYGKDEADKIICRYIAVLKDFIQGDECLGRLGGDNFVALILKNRTMPFLKLIEKTETYAYVAGQMITVEISAVAGILEIEDDIKDYGQLISDCAVALNVAKNVTKRPFMFLTKEMNKRAMRQKQIRAQFRPALQQGEFVAYYQPKVETDTYSIAGAEALVRWISGGKIVPPGDFIPLIEADGTVCELDFYMLGRVCHDINMWKTKGIEPVRVSVNFSRKHLLNPNFPQQIIDMINDFGINPKYIEIEITETANEEESDMLNIFMHKMQEHGIATAIDDFGTGVSSFNILRNFAVDVLKIDKSFIDDEVMTESDTIVITNIVKMARELNMDVITEGVENWNQVEFLHDIDCHVVQGFLFDRPMPVEQFTEKLIMKRYDITKVLDVQ